MSDETNNDSQSWQSELEKRIQELNKEYAFTMYGDRAVVFSERPSIHFPNEWELHPESPYDFANFYTEQVVVGLKANGEPRLQRLGEAWRDHPKRLTYDRIVFMPGREHVIAQPDREFPLYNLWRGFPHEPKSGNQHERYLEHLHENICQGKDDHHRWLTRWMGYHIQHPGEQGHTAIVIRGEKGTGKTFAAQKYGNLWGRHALTVAKSLLVTGPFNQHLMDKCVLIADEAFFAGNKADDAQLKSLITGDKIVIQPKFVNAFPTPNYLRIFIISNNDQVVVASEDERRYFALECGNKRRKDNNYFEKINRELSHGGYESLQFYFATMDLGNFDPKLAPTTPFLHDQMRHSVKGIKELWYECLLAGDLPGKVEKDGTVLLNAGEFADWAIKKNPRRWSKLSARHASDFFAKELVLDGKQIGHLRLRHWIVPPLASCRETWNQRHFKCEWSELPGWTNVNTNLELHPGMKP
jgi:Mesyanzhinovviridae DNA primase